MVQMPIGRRLPHARLVAVGQFLGMTLWFSATAAAPRIAAEFGLTTTGRRHG